MALQWENYMDAEKKRLILERAKKWWKKELLPAHKRNTVKLGDPKHFNENPFLRSYLAYFLEGNNRPESIAKALIYPRVLGTSITTSFGSRIQKMITVMFEGINGSTTPGIDLEFIDTFDGRKKYCQVKAGPNVINRDDVITVKNHFRDALRLARANHLDLRSDDFMFCLIYGEPSQMNGFVKQVQADYPVVIGKEFWHRFTGDEDFYEDLIDSIGQVANECKMKSLVNKVIKQLSKNIEKQGR